MSDNIFEELNKEIETENKVDNLNTENEPSIDSGEVTLETQHLEFQSPQDENEFKTDMNEYSQINNNETISTENVNPYQSNNYYNDNYSNYPTPADNVFTNQYSENVNPYREFSNPYKVHNPYEINNKKEKAPKAKISKGFVALIIVICIVFSATFGFLGAFLANNISQGGSNSPMIVHEISPDTEKAPNTVDKSDAQITKEVADSVVEVTTEIMTTNKFYGQYTTEGAGSGVIISSEDNESYILTNNHVIENASSISVTTRDGKNYDAQLIGYDSKLDIALLKVNVGNLKCAVFGDSSKIVVGDKAVAIGNPLGSLGGSVTSGIISALDRNIELDGEVHSLMQTDAAINPGNSGGGLFNGQGELIGIVVAKSTGEAVECLGFAIPTNDIEPVLSDLKQYGYVRGRGDIGFEAVDVSNNLYAMYQFGGQEPGVYVASVSSGSSAAKAGVQPGYRIVSVNGKEVSDTSEFKKAIEGLGAGEEVKFVFAVGDKKTNITYKLDEYKPISGAKSQSSNNNSAQDDFDMFDFFGY